MQSVQRYAGLGAGDPAPLFHAVTSFSSHFPFDSAAGRYIVLYFFGSACGPSVAEAMVAIQGRQSLFDLEKLVFFGVSIDPADRASGRVRDVSPGIQHVWDFDGSVSRLYGALPSDIPTGLQGAVPFRRLWCFLDPMLRIRHVIPCRGRGEERTEVFEILESLPDVNLFAGQPVHAPILFLPDVFEPAFCRRLVELYEEHGGGDSGFMREIDGKTVGVYDYSQKRRRDYVVEDPAVIATVQNRIGRRLVPEIAKAYQFRATRMERYIVACYDSEEQGHFRAHRDNTTGGTAHRRFAVSINLNEDFEGGEICFPEYGARGYRPPPGGAVVFSCSLLHAVSKVTKGRRYVFLPFLYDEEASRVRIANNPGLANSIAPYRG